MYLCICCSRYTLAGSAVYTYTPDGLSSTDSGVIDLTLDLGQIYNSNLISFGISVPITQVESITIDSNNIHNYIITEDWTNGGKTVVDGSLIMPTKRLQNY